MPSLFLAVLDKISNFINSKYSQPYINRETILDFIFWYKILFEKESYSILFPQTDWLKSVVYPFLHSFPVFLFYSAYFASLSALCNYRIVQARNNLHQKFIGALNSPVLFIYCILPNLKCYCIFFLLLLDRKPSVIFKFVYLYVRQLYHLLNIIANLLYRRLECQHSNNDLSNFANFGVLLTSYIYLRLNNFVKFAKS